MQNNRTDGLKLVFLFISPLFKKNQNKHKEHLVELKGNVFKYKINYNELSQLSMRARA